MSEIHAKSMTMHSFFTENLYFIPEYQRGYSWSKNEWEDLWEDIQIQLEEGENIPHFYGQIVIHSDEDKKYIIDGQQRVTTLVIIISVLRFHFDELSNIEDQDQPFKKDVRDAVNDTALYIGSGTSRAAYRLTLGNLGHDFFERYVQKQGKTLSIPIKETTNLTEKNIRLGLNYYNDEIKKSLKGKTTDEKFILLDNILSTIVKRFQIAYMLNVT